MGFVDFLVPFATAGNVVLFEVVVFLLGVLSVVVAWYAVKYVSESSNVQTASSISYPSAPSNEKAYP